ncbi:hypothetical protein ABL78_2756 [Leptomonas seymouri]|uniref:Fungal lipase-type domain-containing protein n=1 Tax=Leptomonas seymouri TaxID=5684 RepID=A0A0N0P6Z3_LEPSE|nr:hypothetical protein ABL78_2756 [Leptomonas seymouri]|eukprot:KPI88179.1 hypothetical protein ABL78_2756 [Leptomonas seymouri]
MSQWTQPIRKRSSFTRSIRSSALPVRHSYNTTGWSNASSSSSINSRHMSTTNSSTKPPHRKSPVSWLLCLQWMTHRLVALQRAAASRTPLHLPITHAAVRCQRAVEWFLSVVERPAQMGMASAVITLRIALQLGTSVLQLCLEAYLHVFSPRLRRLLRFALGVPFLAGALFLLEMREWYFPEVGTGLDTSCVASLPLCHTVEEAMARAALLQQRYREFLVARKGRGQGVYTDEVPADASLQATPQLRRLSLIQPLTFEEENALLGDIFVLIRSIETQIVGTAEERELITPRAHEVATAAPPTPLPPQSHGLSSTIPIPSETATTITEVELEDTVTATPRLFEPSSAATPAKSVVVSPAEHILRSIMAITIAEGWADITEHTRALFQELVRHKTPPVQSRIVQAVGELCSLSYELESVRVDAITLDQRKRIAAAIDAFRPEKSVEERCTIAHEISILPLPDFDLTTRCIGMIRASPGRKPQLILCFVGSNTKRNWLTNFNYWPVPLPKHYGVVGAPLLPDSNDSRVAQPQVHRGFLGLVQTIPYKEVAADFDHILLVGHSLGGALAQLAGLDLAAERPSRRITVVTMASPRVLAVDWRSRLRMARQHAWQRCIYPADALQSNGSQRQSTSGLTAGPQPDNAHERDALADMLVMPPNYRHFRGYLQPDVVPHLPPDFLHFTHSGQRIPLNTGCATSLSFMAWGMYSELYHSADLYKSVLKQPIVSQTHWYVDKESSSGLVDPTEYVRVHA